MLKEAVAPARWYTPGQRTARTRERQGGAHCSTPVNRIVSARGVRVTVTQVVGIPWRLGKKGGLVRLGPGLWVQLLAMELGRVRPKLAD